jgi:hypothetical protein
MNGLCRAWLVALLVSSALGVGARVSPARAQSASEAGAGGKVESEIEAVEPSAEPAVEQNGQGAPAAASTDSSRWVARGFDAPTWVMARSALIPGWGQAKNGSWWKAILVAGIEGAFLERLYFEDRMVRAYRAKAAVTPMDSDLHAYYDMKLHRHAGHRRDFTWWTASLLLLSLGDAYVDAHLRGFDVRLEGEREEDAFAPPGRGESRIGVGIAFAW